MANRPRVAVITVFHNSEKFVDRYVEALHLQTRQPDLVVMVDSGSLDPSCLNRISATGLNYKLLLEENIGFCKGNNLGYAHSNKPDYVFFLNPDAFPSPEYIEQCLRWFEQAPPEAAAISGALLGFDIDASKPTGTLDSTGIVRTRYGQLVDRDQGLSTSRLTNYPPVSSVPALCGAAIFCKRRALESVSPHSMIFDESFFAYKEDIDFSWRLRRAGWGLYFLSSLRLYHCRGWKRREDVPWKLRLLSARNEVKLYCKHPSLYGIAALTKYFLVRLFRL